MSSPLPDGAPSWVAAIFFAGAIIIALGRTLSEASEVWAKFFGPLGRRWRRRASERAQRRRNEGAQTLTRQQVQIMVDEAVEKATTDLTDELHELTEYWAYDADYHRRTRIFMAEQNWQLPPPVHLTLTEWRAKNDPDTGRQGMSE